MIYCVVNNPATAEQYDAAIERQTTARTSLDESKVVLKWRGATPDPFVGLPTLTHGEALALMASPEWSEENG